MQRINRKPSFTGQPSGVAQRTTGAGSGTSESAASAQLASLSSTRKERAVVREAYDACRYFHGTTTSEVPALDNVRSLLTYGFDSRRKRGGDMDEAVHLVSDVWPAMREKMKDREAYIASHESTRTIEANDGLDADQKREALRANRERLMTYIDRELDPRTDEEFLDRVASDRNRHFITKTRSVADNFANARALRFGVRDKRLQPVIMRVLYGPDDRMTFTEHGALESNFVGGRPPAHFRTRRRPGPHKGGENSFIAELAARGYRGVSFEEASRMLDEEGSDLDDDVPREGPATR